MDPATQVHQATERIRRNVAAKRKAQLRARRGTKHAKGATKSTHDHDAAVRRRRNAKQARRKARK